MATIMCLSTCSFTQTKAFIRRPFEVSKETFSWKKKQLWSRATSTSSLNCTCQISPLPTQQKPLFKSLLLHQGMVPNLVEREDQRRKIRTSEEMVEKIRKELRNPSDQRSKLTLVDSIQRLGVGHYFQEEIKVILEAFSESDSGQELFETALGFRLLRHNGLPTSSDGFGKFMNKNGEFKESLSKDTCGMLSLYEASYLGAKDEDILLKAIEFTRTSLKQSIPFTTPQLQNHVAKALELPRHLRMATLEARNYMDEYSLESNYTPALLELAKLEFNELQSLHKRELTEILRWWQELDLVAKLDFARDRPFECFLWTAGIFPEASHSSIRIELTKTICILLVIDDIFDSYGSLDELVLFNDAIQRWELSAMEDLPEYMKICYMALYNTTNEIAYRVLKQHGRCIIPHLKRTWKDVIEAQLLEAQWFNKQYTPTFEEYLTNGVTTGGSYMALVHSFFLIGQGVTKETISMMTPYPQLFSCAGKILRLWDDLGTAKEEEERGDVAKSMQCYMRENNVSCEDEGRKHIRQMIGNLWLELNGELKTPKGLPQSITKACFNLARTAQVIYQHGDDQNAFTVDDHVQTLFFRPCHGQRTK